MITSSTRHGLFVIFILLLSGVNEWLRWFDMYSYFMIVIGAGIILKLTDIENAIQEVRR